MQLASSIHQNLLKMVIDVDKLGIDKLETTPFDLSKVSNIVKNDVAKRMYIIDWLNSQRALHVKSTSIPRGYYVDTSKSKFRRISTSFPRTFSM